MESPGVRYLERDGALLAYQVVGDAGADVLYIGEAASHFDLCWTDPHLHALYERGATFARTAYMQIRGLGLSEPIRYYPTLEQQADDVIAVLDAAGMRRATLVGSYNRRMMALLERCSATPAFALTYVEAALAIDLTPYLPAIQARVRVLYGPTAPEPEAVVRRAVELLPNATFHRLRPASPGSSVGESFVQIGDHIEEVATGVAHRPDADRFLGTVLFTDLVASTELLARIGDAEYRDVRAAHERQVRLLVEQNGGRLMHVTGDGTLSLFDGPTRAVRCAHDICRSATELGVHVRTGVHTGELERIPGDVSGLSVHIGARIAALAEPDEVLVSNTVRDLVSGSGLTFGDRGVHKLRGVPGEWSLAALTGVRERPTLEPAGKPRTRLFDRAAVRTARTAPGATRAALRLGNAMERYRARVRPRDLVGERR